MKWFFILILPMMLAAQDPTLETIALYGNSRTKDFVILRELESKEGERLSEALLRKDRAWLLRQNFLKRIEFQIKPGSSVDKRLLMLVVQEKGWMSISPIVANKDVYGWYAGLHATTRNLLGFRNSLDAIIQFGGLKRFALEWSNPWIGAAYRIFTRLTLYHTAFRYRFTDHATHFDERDSGVTFAVGKGFGRRFQVGVEMGVERVWVEDPQITFSEDHIDDLTILAPFFTFDSRDWPQYPKTGVFVHSSMRWVSTAGNHRYRRWSMDGRLFAPVYHDNILAIQSVLNLTDGRIPVYKRIHIGGVRTLRGYSEGALGGENSLLLSMEYRIPILYERNPLAGMHGGYACVLFFDTANTWFGDETFTLKGFQSSAGLGFHAIWDDLVIRVEYGYRGRGLGFIVVGSGVKF